MKIIILFLLFLVFYVGGNMLIDIFTESRFIHSFYSCIIGITYGMLLIK